MRPLKRSTMPLICGWRGGASRCLAGKGCASNVESVLAAGLLVFGSETVGKLRAVVGEDLIDLDGRRQLEPTQEIDTARLRHIAADVHENPARCPVDSDKEVTPRGLVRRLRQILDVDVNEAGFVVLESLFRRDLLSLGRRNQVCQSRHAFTLSRHAMPVRETAGLMYCLVMKSRS